MISIEAKELLEKKSFTSGFFKEIVNQVRQKSSAPSSQGWLHPTSSTQAAPLTWHLNLTGMPLNFCCRGGKGAMVLFGQMIYFQLRLRAAVNYLCEEIKPPSETRVGMGPTESPQPTAS